MFEDKIIVFLNNYILIWEEYGVCSDNILEDAYSHLETLNVSFLGTASNSQPFVRPMMLIYLENRFFYATGVEEKKIEHLKDNPLVETCILLGSGDNGGSLRIRGNIVFVEDLDMKKMVSDSVPFINRFWGRFDSPSYELMELLPNYVEYMKPGTTTVNRIRLNGK